MKNFFVASLLAGTLAAAGACRSQADAAQDEAAELAARETRLAEKLAAERNGSPSGKPLAKWLLPAELREVSGLAITKDGRLLAHNDEQGIVSVFDARKGVLLKRFIVGENGTRDDFEGITVGANSIFMITSKGVLYEFQEGADGARVPYTQHDTGLSKECEFEGVVYEPDSALLVMPCKVVAKKKLKEHLVIYRWRPGQTNSSRPSMLSLPVDRVAGANPWKKLHISDITLEPTTRNYVLIASQEKALVEITPGGDVVRALPLPGKPRQPEGVALTADSILIVGDEGSKRPADITLYRWPIGPSAGMSR